MKAPLFIEQLRETFEQGLRNYKCASAVGVAIRDRGGGQTHLIDPSRAISFLLDSRNVAEVEELFERPGESFQSGDLIYVHLKAGGISQIWCVHPEGQHVHAGPVKEWIRETALTAYDFLSEGRMVPRQFGALEKIRNFSASATKQFIQNEFQSYSDINPVELISRITNTYEEGKKADGSIMFYNALENVGQLPVKFAVKGAPSIANAKYIRKLLSATAPGETSLIIVPHKVVGIGPLIKRTPEPGESKILSATFRRGQADIFHLGAYVCSVFEGQFFANSPLPAKDDIRAMLARCGLQTEKLALLSPSLEHIIRYIYSGRTGCSIVIDLAEPPIRLAGEVLDPPVDVTNDEAMPVIMRLAQIDGALHLDGSGKVRGFGCLLDGDATDSEDRSRGARYNSAIRFTARNSNAVVITISSDGPISFFKDGRERSNSKT